MEIQVFDEMLFDSSKDWGDRILSDDRDEALLPEMVATRAVCIRFYIWVSIYMQEYDFVKMMSIRSHGSLSTIADSSTVSINQSRAINKCWPAHGSPGQHPT
ncbi:hypothetical protein MUK42_21071 [Musa troglodytarum]|uniref:Uncharacterized protein n=1 Tax=Musa troglodytarum TaxID=320322 RepID=A0A9E7EKF9_9LILI|nr:hypothetical protein MUK42_21071 [Musa troglodytarum]